MQTLDRYIQHLFLKNLGFILLALVSLYAIIDFIEKVDDFIEHGAALSYYLIFPLYNLPLIISNTLPMAVLLSAFATIGGLSRTSQLTALLSGGISLSRLSKPIFLVGVLLCGLLLVCNLWLVPMGVQETEYIKNVQIKKMVEPNMSQSNDLFFRSGNRIIHIQRSFPQHQTVLGITVNTFSDDFKLINRLVASSGNYQNAGVWKLEDVRFWQFSPDGKSITEYQEEPSAQLDLKKEPSEITHLWNKPEEMTQPELNYIIQTLKADGHDPQKFQVESHLRISKAFIPVIMILLGMPFALQRGRNASFSLGIVVSLTIFIIYFVLYATFAALGGAAILSPLIAAWAANVLMGLTGSWMFLKAQD